MLAEELGAFERQGLDVEIRREVSWANVRDKLALGLLDASHILAPLPLALTLGIDSVSVPLVNVMTLHLNGNALTLSQALWQEIEEAAPEFAALGPPLDARAIAAVVARRAAAGRPQLVLASVFPYSVQHYMLRLWLSSGGVDPDRDVRLTIVPPPHTVAHLSGGVIDGYCVGEPWNRQAEALGIGRIALTGPDIWKGMPEKVLGTTESFAANNPETLRALIKALLEACQWLDDPANRAETARVLSQPRYLNMPAEVMLRTLSLPDFHVFHRHYANFPWRSHADWFLAPDGALGPGLSRHRHQGHGRPRLSHRHLSPGRCRDGCRLSGPRSPAARRARRTARPRRRACADGLLDPLTKVTCSVTFSARTTAGDR